MNEFTIKALPNHFRVKKLNAIEVLAMKTQVKVDDYDETVKTFKTILELIEIQVDDSWLPVKEKGKEIYYPASLIENFTATKELVEYVLGTYLKSVFQESNG